MLLMILYCVDNYSVICMFFAVDIVFLKIEKSNNYYSKKHKNKNKNKSENRHQDFVYLLLCLIKYLFSNVFSKLGTYEDNFCLTRILAACTSG